MKISEARNLTATWLPKITKNDKFWVGVYFCQNVIWQIYFTGTKIHTNNCLSLFPLSYFSALEVKSNLQSVQYLCLAWSSQTIAKKYSTSNESGRLYRGGSISRDKRNGTLFTYSS